MCSPMIHGWRGVTMLCLLAAVARGQREDPRQPLLAAMQKHQLLLRQFAGNEPERGAYAELGLRPAMEEFAGQRDLPAAYWVWSRPYWFLFRDGPGTPAAKPRRYGPEQATGEPDSLGREESCSAWEPSAKDAGDEWLLLEYGEPMAPTRIDIFESHGGGALERVTVFDLRGREIEVWNAASETRPQVSGWHNLQVPGILTARVKLYLRTDRVPGWNQIDAVGLVDKKGVRHWARAAAASSTYADVEAKAPAK